MQPAQDTPVVLIVDDDLATTDLLVEFLNEEPGFAACSVTVPSHALTLARTQRVDLLVLDVMMPGMSGLEMFEHLRADPMTNSIPTLFMTASRFRDDVAGRTGCVVLQKPFDLDTFLAAVQSALSG